MAFLFLSLLGAGIQVSEAGDVGKARRRYILVIHGGAGNFPRPPPNKINKLLDQHAQLFRVRLRHALRIGNQILERGGTSLDAVETVIRTLEDDPLFNAGKGAVFNKAGVHELDASIMDGRSLACGGVASIRTVRNPISLARLVMERTDHVLLMGSGADRFAAEMKVRRVEPEYFFTPQTRRLWQELRMKSQPRAPTKTPPGAGQGTVGAVALDVHGNLAAGTSTGGLHLKRPGRVGDSPIIGAGTYANNKTCAVSCTGTGEEFIRHAVASTVSTLMEHKGLSLQEASHHVIRQRLRPGMGGLIAVSGRGEVAMEFSTQSLLRGVADSNGRFEVRIWE